MSETRDSITVHIHFDRDDSLSRLGVSIHGDVDREFTCVDLGGLGNQVTIFLPGGLDAIYAFTAAIEAAYGKAYDEHHGLTPCEVCGQPKYHRKCPGPPPPTAPPTEFETYDEMDVVETSTGDVMLPGNEEPENADYETTCDDADCPGDPNDARSADAIEADDDHGTGAAPSEAERAVRDTGTAEARRTATVIDAILGGLCLLV